MLQQGRGLQQGCKQSRQRCASLPVLARRGRCRSMCISAAANVSYEVQKFGGTCLATPERIKAAAETFIGHKNNTCVVVSAIGSGKVTKTKVTDLLLRAVAKASKQDGAYIEDLDLIKQIHVDTATEVLGADSAALPSYIAGVEDDLGKIAALLQAVTLTGVPTASFSEFVVGHGELWSARLFTAYCVQLGLAVKFMDTRQVVVVAEAKEADYVSYLKPDSQVKLASWLATHQTPPLIIATGFIASTQSGRATTLRRNGSDYSATILGELLSSNQITIWTDVDGVFSANPVKVPEAVCLPSMTYNEAWELAYFGANVLHPQTTLPAMTSNIPIVIKNFFNRSHPGTRISGDPPGPRAALSAVTGFSTIDSVTLVCVEGTGMAGVPGIASTIFTAVREINVNVIMISQASSEQSLCFAVRSQDGEAAVKQLKDKLAYAMSSGQVSAVTAQDKCCLLAAVGQGMVNRKGVAATFLGALAKANVNIKAIAQGSSEYNITVLVAQADAERALRAAHGRFYLSSVPLGVAVVGPGLVGATLVRQLAAQRAALKSKFNIDLRVVAISDSKTMLLDEGGVSLEDWETKQDKAVPADLGRLGTFLAESYLPNRAIVDCTASDTPVQMYATWMKQGMHIITPNKKLGSGDMARYAEVRQLQRDGVIHFFYEATVGAGLPIMGTLKHLMDTGDEIGRIEGVFSGTISYIFNTWKPGMAFSEVVLEAKAKGYTEPDPRDDLSGTDVARKVVILARECGVDLGLEDVAVESLVPAELQDAGISREEYLAKLPQHDAAMAARIADTAARGMCLRYVGEVDVGARTASVRVREFPLDHAFAQLVGTDNIISFTTARYYTQPLVVRGPGAGAEVTAAGIFSDILRLASYLGAPS